MWDTDDFDPWSTLDWPTVRVLRYRQHKPDGKIIEAEWLTDFSIAKLGSRSFFKLAKSRWEIENQGFNDGKNLYGMEHIQHHHPNSMLVNWLFLLLALIIEPFTASATCTGGHTPFLLPNNSRTSSGSIWDPLTQTPVDPGGGWQAIQPPPSRFSGVPRPASLRVASLTGAHGCRFTIFRNRWRIVN